MNINWDKLIVKFDRNLSDLLGEWRWLIGESAEPILITALGDAFVRETNASIWWLDVGGGQFNQVAESEEDFKKEMLSNVEEWFIPQLVEELLSRGMVIGPNQVFSYKLAPTLNGQYEADNFEPTDLSVHFAILGSIQRQVSELPDGTKINRFQ